MKEFIQSWKDFLMIETGGKKYFFVHGSPIDRLKGYIYPDTDLSPFSDVEWDVIVMGHTHYPFLREEYHKIFINAGSVGLPRDAGNLSSLVLIDTDPLHIHHYRLRFDAEKILSEIKKENLHEATVERLRRGNDIPAFGMEVKN